MWNHILKFPGLPKFFLLCLKPVVLFCCQSIAFLHQGLTAAALLLPGIPVTTTSWQLFLGANGTLIWECKYLTQYVSFGVTHSAGMASTVWITYLQSQGEEELRHESQKIRREEMREMKKRRTSPKAEQIVEYFKTRRVWNLAIKKCQEIQTYHAI